MVLRFKKLVKDRWETVPAAPVVVLPFENDQKGPMHQTNKLEAQEKSE